MYLTTYIYHNKNFNRRNKHLLLPCPLFSLLLIRIGQDVQIDISETLIKNWI